MLADEAGELDGAGYGHPVRKAHLSVRWGQSIEKSVLISKAAKLAAFGLTPTKIGTWLRD